MDRARIFCQPLADPATRAFLVLLSKCFHWREILFNVTPQTCVRWHRRGFRSFSEWKLVCHISLAVVAGLTRLDVMTREDHMHTAIHRRKALCVMLGPSLALLAACSGTPRSTQAPAEPQSPAPSAPLMQTVREVTDTLHAQRIMYDERPGALADCSGIFLRAASKIAAQCAEVNAPPDPRKTRSSAAIADWYGQRGHYTAIDNPLVQDHLIRPSMVLFYKYPKEAEISHMGVVANVQQNGRGEVERYWLFHGRDKGKQAAITSYHYRNPRKDVPLGVGAKVLVGAAPLCPQGSCQCNGKPMKDSTT